ncbi:class I SAM-dependent methyltransferase [Streptomyces sp. 6N223]|uniref:class I SAM-dependent methyltransferase n=1 Tax=Streptomyces sp. 6N223 TaxID=3457412 RepID=UPI003FD66B82
MTETAGSGIDWQRINRENWDDRTRVHAQSATYDLPGFRAKPSSTLRPFEPGEMGEVAGRSLVHLQCHMGLDTLSWARLGARVTGVDFSAPAIDTARSLASDIGVADRARFVVSDVYGAPAALAGERFDIVYTGVGALVWLPDLTRWAEVVASLLKEGGALYLVEFHPVTDMLDDETGHRVTHDYFCDEPHVEDFPYTYTDGPQLTKAQHVEFHHTLGDLINAIAGAGLRIEFFHEFDYTLFGRYESLRWDDSDGGYGFRLPAGQPRVPLMYSLRATR